MVITVVKKESRSILLAKASHKAIADLKGREIVSLSLIERTSKSHCSAKGVQIIVHIQIDVQKIEVFCTITVPTLSVWNYPTLNPDIC